MTTQINSIYSDYLIAGFSILPVDAQKKPIGTWKHLQEKPMSDEEIKHQFRNAYGVAVVCGNVSEGLEIIDFDAHNKDIDTIYNEWLNNKSVEHIINGNSCFIERTPRGGYHIAYRYECSGKRDGNRKIASWENAESMIETRGEGGYCIITPTPGYITLQGDVLNLPILSKEERDYLLSEAEKFNRLIKKTNGNGESVGNHEFTDPVSWYNWNKAAHAKKILQDHGWRIGETDSEGIEHWIRPGKDEGTSATWGRKHNALYVFSTSVENFESETYYTPFQILVKLQYKGQYYDAINWIMAKYHDKETENQFIRVGSDYYKKIRKHDRYGIERIELKPWKKSEISQDNGKDFVKNIPQYDDFTIKPSNFEYLPVFNNCYNLYRPITHTPKEGTFYWSEILMNHIFGDQVNLGYRYMKILYLHPEKLMPIFVMVSRERQTGKTTFLNWLNMIFGSNVANISPEDLTSGFNFMYATSNIIAVEEALIEKNLTVEKLKALATSKFITVNQKFVSQFKIPFYGKIILASNNEDKFARIDEEEIRFFVRKVGLPKFINHEIESALLTEIPAFLYHLTKLLPVDFSKDRSGFTPDELKNNSLTIVKQESKSSLYKDLMELITEEINNHPKRPLHHSDPELIIYATPTDIKDKWFRNNSRIDIQYIRHVLKNEFRLKPTDKTIRYIPFGSPDTINTKVGAAYAFSSKDYLLPTDSISDNQPNIYEPPF